MDALQDLQGSFEQLPSFLEIRELDAEIAVIHEDLARNKDPGRNYNTEFVNVFDTVLFSSPNKKCSRRNSKSIVCKARNFQISENVHRNRFEKRRISELGRIANLCEKTSPNVFRC